MIVCCVSMEEEYEVTELEQKPTTPKNVPPSVEMVEKTLKRGDQTAPEKGDKKSETEGEKSEKEADAKPEREAGKESVNKDGRSDKVG